MQGWGVRTSGVSGPSLIQSHLGLLDQEEQLILAQVAIP